jgi:hypothetical protein
MTKNKKQNTKKPKNKRQVSQPPKQAKQQDQMQHTYINGNSILGALGMMAGNGISKIFGLGAYKIKQNNLMDSKTGRQVPFMHSTAEMVTFRHREFLGDVVGSVAFSSTSYNVNPGLDSTFPYLSVIASAFSEYKFKGLVFEFKSTSADALNSTNTALGTVAMVAQYRSDATAPRNKMEVLNEMWSCDSKPSEDLILPIECAPIENPMAIQYVRTGALLANNDIKMFDLAKVIVATVGMQAAATIGELWVSYEVELYKPVMPSQISVSGQGVAQYTTTLGGSGIPYGATQTATFDSIGLRFNASGTTLNFPIGDQNCYHVIVYLTFAAIACTSPAPAYGGGAVAATSYLPRNSPNSGTVTDSILLSTYVDLSGVAENGFGTLAWPTLVINPAVGVVWVEQVPYA